MKKAKNKVLIAALGAAVIGTFGVAGLLTLQNTGNTAAYADTTVEETEQFQIVKDVENIVATYSFTILSETECSVKITNKSVATKAIIPSTAEIGGQTYKVTEIAANGFSSSSKLIRVSFPSTLKKVGNNAFASCSKLKSINLANVKEIGNGAFSRCPELADILMPLSVEKVGTYVFRNNNTKVRIRAKEAECETWATTWNNYNNNQEKEYESHYVQPMVLEEIYDTMARTANPEVIGYAIAGGQPLSEKYQPEAVNYGIQTFADIDDDTITPDNRDNFKDEDGNIYVPSEYEGIDILYISDSAFDGSEFNQLIIESSVTGEAITIGNNAFYGTIGENITINRPVEFYDKDAESASTDIFHQSTIKTVVLPNNITEIVESMFYDCTNLSNIYFIEPEHITDRATMLGIIEKQVEAEAKKAENDKNWDYGEGILHLPNGSSITAIGNFAFYGATSIQKLYIEDGITTVGMEVLSGWDNASQTVYINITDESNDWDAGWSSEWKGDFTNVKQQYYTITFEPNDGTVNPTYKKVEYGKEMGELPEPEYIYHDFKGWVYYNEKGEAEEYQKEGKFILEKDITLTAQWDWHQYTITFDDNDGTGGPGTKNFIYGDSLSRIDIPTKRGYIFKGYKIGNEKYYYDDGTSGGRTWQGNEDITLIADWEGMQCTIFFDKDEGKGGQPSVEVKYGDPLPSIGTITKEGYNFAGFYFDINNEGTKYYDTNGDSVVEKWDRPQKTTYLHAKWDNRTYTITLDWQDNGKTNTVSDLVYNENIIDKPELLYDRPGYKFLGFFERKSKESKGTQYYDSKMYGIDKWSRDEENITIYAHWYYATFDVILDSQGAKNYKVKTIHPTYKEPMPQESTIPEKDGYIFKGYYDAEGKQYYTSSMGSANNWDKTDNNVTLYAEWTAKTYSIELKCKEGEEGVGGDTKTTVTYNGKLSNLNLPERKGYDFIGYFLGDDNYYDINKEEQKVWQNSEEKIYTLYAKWKAIESNLIFVNRDGTEIKIAMKYDESMPEMYKFDWQGYTFKGYFDSTDDSGRTYYDKHGYKIIQKYENTEDTKIYAHCDVINYYVTYKYQDNNKDIEKKEVFNVEHTDLTFIPYSKDKLFKAWVHDGDIIENFVDIFHDITVTPEWSELNEEINLNHVDDTTLELYSNFIKIILPETTSLDYVININKNVKQVNVIGVEGKTYKMKINITERTEDFNLVLENIYIIGSKFSETINMDSEAYLNLHTYGEVIIFGKNGISPDLPYQLNPDRNSSINGMPAIKCGKLFIDCNSKLCIKGGSGASTSKKGYKGGSAGAAVYVSQNILEIEGQQAIVTLSAGSNGNGGDSNGPFMPGGPGLKSEAVVGTSIVNITASETVKLYTYSTTELNSGNISGPDVPIIVGPVLPPIIHPTV